MPPERTAPVASAAPPLMPEGVRQHLQNNPDALNSLLHADTLTAILTESATTDWCVACGASASRAPQALSDPAALTDEQIDALAQRLGTRPR